MKAIRSVLGYMIAGMLVMAVWGGIIDGGVGTIGGILAGFLIIGVAWFLNHHLGLIYHGPKSAFVDLGLGVCMTGLFRDMWISIFTEGTITNLTNALPTLALVLVGGAVGGVLAALVERDLNKDKEVSK